MLRDASQKQVIQKFSFIESLNLSRALDNSFLSSNEGEKNSQSSGEDNLAKRQIVDEIDVNQAFNFLPHTNSKPDNQTQDEKATSVAQEQNAALVSTKIKAGTLANRPESNTVELDIAELVKYSVLKHSLNDDGVKERNYLGKVIFAVVLSYCSFVLWWLFGHQASKLITQMMGGRHLTLSKSDVEFINHMERSLDNLERQLEAKKADNQGEDKVVYVPVYTPQNNTPIMPAPVAIARPQVQPQTQAIKSAETPTPKALKIPAPPPLPEPTPLPPTNTSQPSETIGAIVEPTVKYTLTGILDLGVGKSAALVKVNGQTRRFWLGEEIGSSGWILESLSNQTAKINYQGQVRSIAVGESF